MLSSAQHERNHCKFFYAHAVCDICAEDEAGCIERGQEEGAHHPRQRHAVHDHHQHDGITKSRSEADEGVGRPLVRCARVVGEVDAKHDDVDRCQEQRKRHAHRGETVHAADVRGGEEEAGVRSR